MLRKSICFGPSAHILCVYRFVLLCILVLSPLSLLWHLYPGCKCYLAVQMVPRLCIKNPNDGCFPKSLALLLLRWCPSAPPIFCSESVNDISVPWCCWNPACGVKSVPEQQGELLPWSVLLGTCCCSSLLRHHGKGWVISRGSVVGGLKGVFPKPWVQQSLHCWEPPPHLCCCSVQSQPKHLQKFWLLAFLTVLECAL